MKYGNLHLHSNQSDGGFRPAFLVRLAKSLGYGAIALTDHETLTGIPELFAAAEVEVRRFRALNFVRNMREKRFILQDLILISIIHPLWIFQKLLCRGS